MNKTGINDLKEEAMVERLEKGWQEAALAYDIGTPFGAFSIAMDELKTAIAHIRQQEARIAEQEARIAELEAEADGARNAILALKHKGHDGCWCQVSIGNPMFTGHTDACKLAIVALTAPTATPLNFNDSRKKDAPPADQKGEEPRHE